MTGIDLGTFYYAFGIVALISGAIVVIRSKTSQKVTTEYRELAGAQQKSIVFLKDEVRKIPDLQRQVNELKTIPLQEISKTLKSIDSNQTKLAKTLDSGFTKLGVTNE